jgi:hypothetical protein
MSLLKKGLVKTGNDGKIDTNFLKMNEIIPPGTVVANNGKIDNFLD